MTMYAKTMREAREEMLQSLNENNLEKMRKAAGGAKQTLKMKDGSIGVDSFTASAIMQIYDKINDKNKKTFENMMKNGKKADIMKLQKFALSKINAEYVPEEIELDEAKYELYHKDFSTAMQHAYKMAKKNYGITVDPKEIDDKVASGPKKPSEGKTNTYRLEGDKGAIQVQVYNKGGSKPFELNMYKEEVEFDEGTKQVLAHGGKGQYKAVRDGGITKIMYKGKVVGTADFDSGADSFFVSMKGVKGQKSFDDAQAMVDYFAKNKITEEVELDEDIATMAMAVMGLNAAALLPVLFMAVRELIRGTPLESSIKNVVDKLKKNKNYKMSDSEKSDVKGFVSKVKKDKPSLLQKAVKQVKLNLLKDQREEVDLDEAEIDPADIDTSATDDDIKSADKNIMMQLRKSVSLRGQFPVEFLDKKKVKIPQKIAQAALTKYSSLKKPVDKEKFQSKIAKSHRDLLMALKESNEKMDTFDEIKNLMRKLRENNNG